MITYEEARQRVAPIVQANPEHVARCRYFGDDGEACCIVGKAFEPELRAAGVGWGSHNTSRIGVLASGVLAGVFDAEAREWLDYLQDLQDEGFEWGDALLGADEAKAGWDEAEAGIVRGTD